jgi:hypothetical protein
LQDWNEHEGLLVARLSNFGHKRRPSYVSRACATNRSGGVSADVESRTIRERELIRKPPGFGGNFRGNPGKGILS